MDVCRYRDVGGCLSFLLALPGLFEEICVCSAELIAGAVGVAYMGDMLENTDISTYSGQVPLVKKVDTGASGMTKAGNGISREENEV